MTADVTGLTSAQQFAAGMAAVHTGALSQTASFRASVHTAGVSGDAIAAATRAADAQQQVAAAWEACHAALHEQDTVAQAYAAHPDAGSKEFLTETGGGEAVAARTTTQPAAEEPMTAQPAPPPKFPASFRLRNAFERWTLDGAVDGDGLVLNLKYGGDAVAARLTPAETVNTYRQLTEMLTTGSRKQTHFALDGADGSKVEVHRRPKDGEVEVEVYRWDDEVDDGDAVAISMVDEDAYELHVRLTGMLLTAGWLVLR